MYRIMRITDRVGVVKDENHTGFAVDAKMDEGCVLFHCRFDPKGKSCDKFIRTSLVQSWKKDKESGRIVVETMNSVYYLEPQKHA